MAQGSEFPLRKPPGFHYDFFLLGVTTFLAGLLGLPAPNGLIPQAPSHTASLLVMVPSLKDEEESVYRLNSRNHRHSQSSIPVNPTANFHFHEPDPSSDPAARQKHEIPIRVVEQRASNLAQGTLCLVLLSGPFLHLLHLIPRGV